MALIDTDKYTITESDWLDIGIVHVKLSAQNVVSLLSVLENTLSPYISPEETKEIDNLRLKLLNYIDENFLQNNK